MVLDDECIELVEVPANAVFKIDQSSERVFSLVQLKSIM
jgi:hypothetical protein